MWSAFGSQKGGVIVQHIFSITEEKFKLLPLLISFKSDNEFVILKDDRDFCDIAQWSNKYQNIKILTVRKDNLDMRYEIKKVI